MKLLKFFLILVAPAMALALDAGADVIGGVTLAMVPTAHHNMYTQIMQKWQQKFANIIGGVNPDEILLTESYLRVEKSLTDNKTQYRFELDAQTGSEEQEVKLKEPDIFIAVELGLYLVASSSNPAQDELFTYPNDNEFSNATLDHLYGIYNGSLNININRQDIYENISCYDFLYTPNYQLGLKHAIDASQSPNVTGEVQKEPFHPLQGRKLITPQVMFSGHDDKKIDLVTPPHGSLSWENSSPDHRVVFMPRGFLVKGRSNQVQQALDGTTSRAQ